MAKHQPTWKRLRGREALIDDLLLDVDRQLASAEGRTRDLHSRASVLIATASILVGISAIDARIDVWFIAACTFAVVAAICGIVVLIPRYGEEVPLRDFENQHWDESHIVARHALYRKKIDILAEIDSALVWRAWVVSAGFACLILCLVAAALTVIAE